jgi:hypothetical protein
MMIAVAVVAVLIACLGALGAVEFVALALMILVPIAAAPRGSRLLVSAWVASFYPLLILLSALALWAFAWGALGHQPRPTLDNPLRLMRLNPHLVGPILLPFILVMASPVSLIACMLLPVVSIEFGASSGRGRACEFAPLMILPVAWLSVVALLLWDPLGILVWFVG